MTRSTTTEPVPCLEYFHRRPFLEGRVIGALDGQLGLAVDLSARILEKAAMLQRGDRR